MIVTINIANIPPDLLSHYRAISTEADDVLSIDNESEEYQAVIRKLPMRPVAPVSVANVQPLSGAVARVHPGAILWEELHTTRMTRKQFAAWLGRVATLPGCQCKNNAAKHLASFPPVYDADGFLTRQWGWAFHNLINVDLGYAALPYADAALRYGWKHQNTAATIATPTSTDNQTYRVSSAGGGSDGVS